MIDLLQCIGIEGREEMTRKVKLDRSALMVKGSEIAAYCNTFSRTVGLESRKRVAPSIHTRCSKIQSLGNKEEFRYHLPTYELLNMLLLILAARSLS